MSQSVVVIGGGVGGLSAAIHARLDGYDVLLLEASRIGGKAAGIEESGYRLDPGPSIVILLQAYEKIFARAGRRMEDYLTFQRLDPISRVYFEGAVGPLDLPSDRDECVRAIADISPSDKHVLETLLHRLDALAPFIDKSVFNAPIDRPWKLANPNLMQVARYFDVRQTFKEFVDQSFSSPILKAFFYGFPSYAGQSYTSKAIGALLIPYYMLTGGVYYPKGGVAAIPEALERLARDLGVEIRTGAKVNTFQVDKGRIQAVRMETGETYSADAFISNVDRLTTRQLLGIVTSAKPSYSFFTVHWGISKKYRNLRHHTLLIPSGFERSFDQLYRQHAVPESPVIYLNVTSETDLNVAPKNHTNLFAVVTTPAREDTIDWAKVQTQLRKKVIDTVRTFALEFDESNIDFERIQTPLYFEQAHGNYRGSLYGPDEPERLFGGMFPLSCCDDRFRNLFYAGASVQPGAGLPMVAISGRFAADAVKRYLRQRPSP